MGNEFNSTLNEDSIGIISRVIQTIFKRIAANDKNSKVSYNIRLSYLEILNEEVHDLLSPSDAPSTSLSIRDSDKGVFVANLTETTITSVEETFKLLAFGATRRATAATGMNLYSSRSHAICTISMDRISGDETRYSKIHLVDLAGSERVKKTLAEGNRFKEGVFINRGLLALGNVINALAKRVSDPNKHIPYRDAKITRLLQDSLGGNSKTVMIACVSPALINYEETLNTLRYATRAKRIQNKAVVNRGENAEVKALRKQVEFLEGKLASYETDGGKEEDVKKIIEEYEEKLSLSERMIKYLEHSKEKWKAIAQNISRGGPNSNMEMKENISKNEKFDKMILEALPDSGDSTPTSTLGNGIMAQESDSSTKNADRLKSIEASLCIKEQIIQQLNSPGNNILSSSASKQHGSEKQSIDDILTTLKTTYENKIKESDDRIKKLKTKHETLIRNKVDRKRLMDLEEQLKELQEQSRKYEGLRKECLKLKRDNEAGSIKLSQLKGEILMIKKEKVNLQRRLHQETAQHQKDQRTHKMETMKLQKSKDKQQYHLQKLEEMYKKQSNVLNNKTREMSLISQRMRKLLQGRVNRNNVTLERRTLPTATKATDSIKQDANNSALPRRISSVPFASLKNKSTNGSISRPSLLPGWKTTGQYKAPSSEQDTSSLIARIKELEALLANATRENISKKRKKIKRHHASNNKIISEQEEYDLIFKDSDDETSDSDDGNDSDYVDASERKNNHYRERKRKHLEVNPSHFMSDLLEIIHDNDEKGCKCHGKCATKACSCRNEQNVCNEQCRCKHDRCKNRDSMMKTDSGEESFTMGNHSCDMSNVTENTEEEESPYKCDSSFSKTPVSKTKQKPRHSILTDNTASEINQLVRTPNKLL